MADSIEENKWIILSIMAIQPVNTVGQISLNGQKIQELTNLTPVEINDAVSILEDEGYVELLHLLGTHPFGFGKATLTPKGKNEYQKRVRQSDNKTQIPVNFTPEMKDLMMTSLAVFDTMKSTLLSSLTEVGKKYNLNDGLYYIVLIDLSGSTISAGKMSKTDYSKWINGFIKITTDALNFSPKNKSVYIKSSGDGLLFLFGNFDDILDWRSRVNNLCIEYNQKCESEKKPDFYWYNYKTIIHIGEVYFEEDRHDTNSFAVNVVYKIEKQFQKNDLGITEAVKQAITPEINSGRFRIDKGTDYTLEDANVIIPLWKLSINST